MYMLFDFLYCFSFALCSCSLMLPLPCLFHLSFSLHTTQYTQDDEIRFRSHSVPLTNTLTCLWKIREICFSFHVHHNFIEKLLFFCLNVFFNITLLKIFGGCDLIKATFSSQTKRFAPKAIYGLKLQAWFYFRFRSLWLLMEVKRDCAGQKL